MRPAHLHPGLRAMRLYRSRRLREREGRGLSQERLALRAGIPADLYRRIEAGEVRPGRYIAGRLARSLQCRVADLFSEDVLPRWSGKPGALSGGEAGASP